MIYLDPVHSHVHALNWSNVLLTFYISSFSYIWSERLFWALNYLNVEMIWDLTTVESKSLRTAFRLYRALQWALALPLVAGFNFSLGWIVLIHTVYVLYFPCSQKWNWILSNFFSITVLFQPQILIKKGYFWKRVYNCLLAMLSFHNLVNIKFSYFNYHIFLLT